MGRVHVHADGTVHAEGHDHGHGPEDDGGPRDVGDHSGYTATGTARIEVLERILSENDRVAAANRRDFTGAGVISVNLMSSPGAGKTTLLKRTLAEIGGTRRVGILEGDIATSIDADELAGSGSGAAAVSLVNTSAGFGGECHLDAVMVRSGLGRLPLDRLDLLIIENVGNLVCPAEFDVGAHAKAMVYAITEGEEKPLKYPVMFRAVDAVVVNKLDLLPYLDFDLDRLLANLRAVNPAATVIQVSARTGAGTGEWCRWLLGQELVQALTWPAYSSMKMHSPAHDGSSTTTAGRRLRAAAHQRRRIDRGQHCAGRMREGAPDGRGQSHAWLEACGPDADQERNGAAAVKAASQGKHIGSAELMGERASGAPGLRCAGRRIGRRPAAGR